MISIKINIEEGLTFFNQLLSEKKTPWSGGLLHGETVYFENSL